MCKIKSGITSREQSDDKCKDQTSEYILWSEQDCNAELFVCKKIEKWKNDREKEQ